MLASYNFRLFDEQTKADDPRAILKGDRHSGYKAAVRIARKCRRWPYGGGRAAYR